MPSYLGGIDVGASKVGVALVELEDNSSLITRFEKTDVGHESWGIPAQLVRILNTLLTTANSQPAKLYAIGIGSTGPLDENGLANPTNVPFASVPLVSTIQEAFAVPAVLMGDCLAAVLGEAVHGVGRVCPRESLHMAYVNVGTGIGVGVYSGGHLIQGTTGNAGELGHLVIDINGIKCGCGHYGCAEAYGSGVGIAKNARMQLVNEDFNSSIYNLALTKAHRSSPDKLVNIAEPYEVLRYVDAQVVFDAARQSDPLGTRLVEQAMRALGLVLAAVSNAFNPKIITVGGLVILMQADLLMPGMIAEMRKHLRVTVPEIAVTALGIESVLYGAIELARDAITSG